MAPYTGQNAMEKFVNTASFKIYSNTLFLSAFPEKLIELWYEA